jgi:predicted Zn-dependent protease
VAREVPLPWGNRGPARYAVVYYNNMAYVFRGATRLNSALSASDPLFLSSIKTFRRLRDNEFALAEPDRIKLVKAAPGARIEQLAQGSPIRQYPVERLRLLNDLYPNKEPTPGELVKVVD